MINTNSNKFEELIIKEVKGNLDYIHQTHQNKEGMSLYEGYSLCVFKDKEDFKTFLEQQWFGEKDEMFFDYLDFHWNNRNIIPKTRTIQNVNYHSNFLTYFQNCLNVWSFKLDSILSKSLYYQVHYHTNKILTIISTILN